MLRWRIVIPVAMAMFVAVGKGEEKDATKAIRLSVADVKAVRQGNRTHEAEFKKKFDGKVAEFAALAWASNQLQKSGKHKGEMLFSFDLGPAETGKRTGALIPVYMKDESDIQFLHRLKAFNKIPFTMRGRLVVDYTSGFRMWMENGQLVRSKEDRDRQEKERKAWLAEVQKQEKTKDGKGYVLTPLAAQAMRGYDRTIDAIAKEKWNGKMVQVTAISIASRQTLTTGAHAGQTLISFDLDHAATGKRTGNTIAVYFRNPGDIATLQSRKITDKTPFQVRGKLVVDSKGVWRRWIENGELVKE